MTRQRRNKCSKSIDFSGVRNLFSQHVANDISKCGSGKKYSLFCQHCEDLHCQVSYQNPRHNCFDLEISHTLPLELFTPEALIFKK